MYLIFFLLGFCYCNPTTFLSEAALAYLAIDILKRNNIEVINIDNEKYTIAKYENQLDFINKVWESNSEYKLDFKDNYNEWQSTFDKIEQDNINKYLEGHDRIYYSANKAKYAIIAASDELNWKSGNGNNQKLSVNLNNIFGVTRVNAQHVDLLRLFSSIINDKGESNEKKTMSSLLDTISNRRTKKMVSSGQFAAAITEEKANEIAKNNKFDIIQAVVGNQKNDKFCIDLNGNDLDRMDLEKTFYKNSDVGKETPLDENKVKNSKKYFKMGVNDNMVNEVKEALVKNLNSNAKKGAKEHASLVKFTENKDFMKLDYDTSSDSKIKSISCKV